MTSQVTIKHAGKAHTLAFDTVNGSAKELMALVAKATLIPEERQKILVKGGMLKESSDISKIDFSKPIMVMGTPGALPTEPIKKAIFIEDMSDAQLAEATKAPAGLKNLGQTCYMNSTIQCLRAIPELQDVLSSYKAPVPGSTAPIRSDGSTLITAGLSNLYREMRKTSEPYPPLLFLSALRRVVPQFDERDDHGHHAQQDAEECWGQIVQALQASLGGDLATSRPVNGSADKPFIESYMGGSFETKLALADGPSPEEPEIVTTETFRKLDCFISAQTNYMEQGIKAALVTTLEKHSPTLNANASYRKTATLSRLPSYLTVHFVRFFWRADVNAKSKIMRKVKFPFELDLFEFCSDSLKAKILEPRKKMQSIEKARFDRARSRKRQKLLAADSTSGTENTDSGASGKSEAELRQEERKEVEEVIDQGLRSDLGSNTTGLYELIAVLTHKGASADGGHYMSFVRKNAIEGSNAHLKQTNGLSSAADQDDDTWYRFNDDKVDTIPASKIETLDGGGEDSSAYLCLYRSRRP